MADPIKVTFWGGFAVDADFGDGFSGSIEGPKIIKIHEKSIILHFRQGGGGRPQAQCFLWGLFFDKFYWRHFGSYKVKFRPKKSRTVDFFHWG
jgi:hypothetical protein